MKVTRTALHRGREQTDSAARRFEADTARAAPAQCAHSLRGVYLIIQKRNFNEHFDKGKGCLKSSIFEHLVQLCNKKNPLFNIYATNILIFYHELS